jgi:hypothetical protein
MLALFLGFGVFSNLFDGKGLAYNLVQGVFIAVFTGGIVYLTKYLIGRRKLSLTASLKETTPK